ncbi:hypothetical protein [Streptomyces goshikiensis]|uniref:hypothetical protein n=1 Tax=Streptomyces goshikiensis TaxID=1942 RepID=UPI0036CDEBD0
MTMLCIGADRANNEVDPDGNLRDEPVVIEHFLFLLDEVSAEDFAAGIEHPDLVVRVKGDFLTGALDLDVWRPEAPGARRPPDPGSSGTRFDSSGQSSTQAAEMSAYTPPPDATSRSEKAQ